MGELENSCHLTLCKTNEDQELCRGRENQVWNTIYVSTMVQRVSRFLQLREPLERDNVTSYL